MGFYLNKVNILLLCKMDTDIDVIPCCYSASLITGGIYGYIKTGLAHSIPTGFIFGALAGYGAYRSTKDSSDQYLNLGTSFLLTLSTGHRFYKSKKLVPIGLIACFSFLMAVRSSYLLIVDKSKK